MDVVDREEERGSLSELEKFDEGGESGRIVMFFSMMLDEDGDEEGEEEEVRIVLGPSS